ncbi:MAG: Spy0128 family protein [Collinsella sp.]
MREVNGGTTSKGIAYDGKTYTIVTTITDEGDGTLKAEHVLKDAKAAEFKNSYNLTPTESSVTDQVKATKFLTGRALPPASSPSSSSRATRSSPLAPTTPAATSRWAP